MSDYVKRGSTSVIGVIKISKLSDGSPYTGLTFNTAGLFLTARTDNEAAGVTYTQAAGNLEAGTVGSYTTPTAGKCRITEISAVNNPGEYQYELANSRYNVANSNKLFVTVGGASDINPQPDRIQLGIMDSSDFPANFNLLSIAGDGFVGSNVKQIGDNAAVIAAFLKALDSIVEGNATATTLTTTQMSTDLTADNAGKFVGKTVIWRTGPNIETGRLVTASTATPVTLTFDTAPVAPQDGNAFILV